MQMLCCCTAKPIKALSTLFKNKVALCLIFWKAYRSYKLWTSFSIWLLKSHSDTQFKIINIGCIFAELEIKVLFCNVEHFSIWPSHKYIYLWSSTGNNIVMFLYIKEKITNNDWVWSWLKHNLTHREKIHW